MRGMRLEEAARALFAGDERAKEVIRRIVGGHPDGLALAKALQEPGQCLFCEERLTGQHRSVCGSDECWAAYWRASKRDRACQHFIRERQQIERRAPIAHGAQP